VILHSLLPNEVVAVVSPAAGSLPSSGKPYFCVKLLELPLPSKTTRTDAAGWETGKSKLGAEGLTRIMKEGQVEG
jgi:hypothetical protein